MPSLFQRYNQKFSPGVKSYVSIPSIYAAVEQKCSLSKTLSLSISIFAIIALIPVPVEAHLTSKEFPIVISEISSPQIAQQPVNTPIPASEDSGQPPVGVPRPTISPSIPQIPEDTPQTPQESPEFSPPEDIQPSKPTSDIPDDVPRPVRSNTLPSSPPKEDSSGNLLEVTAASNSLDLFAKAIEAAGLTDTLIEDSFTIFAPTNQAFSTSLPTGAMEFLFKSENKDLLQELLRYHIVKGEVAAKELTTGKMDTLGGSIAIRVTPERIILNNSSITRSDIQATNGVVHSINRVLIPRRLRNKITAKMSGKSDMERR